MLEDVSFAPDVLAALAGAVDRLSFDAPDPLARRRRRAARSRSRHLNIKPSRFGPLSRLFECIDACLERGIELYGGGQFELGVGRGQIQEIASLFYPRHAERRRAARLQRARAGGRACRRARSPPPPRRAGFGW